MKAYISILLTCSYLPTVVGFVETASRHSPRTSLKLSPEEERAAVLSDYLVKAHSQKLEAIQRVENTKNAEIKALQDQLAEAKAGALVSVAKPSALVAAASSDELASLSKEELIAKVLSAQQFMQKYIVDAQEQKVKAVAAAEEAVAKKFAIAEAKTPEPTAIVEPKQSTLNEMRNVKVVASAAAGKSRWGEQELQRLSKDSPISTPVSTTTASIVQPKESTLNEKRNAKVVASAAAGKSRWGEQELQRVGKTTPVSTTTTVVNVAAPSPVASTTTAPVNGASSKGVVPPEVEAADHGLRNDGGVGGPSLAARVASGMNTFEGSDGEAPLAASSPKQLLSEKRNARVTLAAKAGKSRWGEQELQRIQLTASHAAINGASTAPSTETAAEVPVPAEVEAADHGLRADGGVGGPSLAQRINLGAQLLQGN